MMVQEFQIFSYNNLDDLPYEDRPKVLDLLTIKEYCIKYVSKETKEQLELLDIAAKVTNNIKSY